ncbi:hypothetical protein AJ79_09810 [Helicocarpus griseus UAMH5409]|uniref:Aminoglycoside phosphotransferase domain-containing protein n=1 Tax=Helicocarpus griseus UAMH5409 TaxID=1447875 RepID=A0A2B7WH36_9EURO|nr:hypothetical protein AJ79_09810 [Helicocarpus griseus UAMH5409]
MDRITQHRLDEAARELIASIDPLKICELAWSFNPDKRRRRIFSEWKKGGVNVCFPVIFDGEIDSKDGEGEDEKWMVRIPLLPKLAYPEEKLRGEIATMMYIAEKITIPIPRLHGYSVKRDNILGLPFILVEYVEGKPLSSTRFERLDESKTKHIHFQLADIYIQLFHQQFDEIGALTLDENNEHWVFMKNRPLTVDINDQEVGGLDICHYLSSCQTFSSVIDYVYFIIKLIFNDFYQGRDSILDEEDARNYLYSIHMSQSILMEWVKPEYNHGPFILMHGDLRPPNILIDDDDFNVVSVLDWEWSHTVPVRFFVPPFWLTNRGVYGVCTDVHRPMYMVASQQFIDATYEREHNFYQQHPRSSFSIAEYWSKQESQDLFIAHGLMRPHHFGTIYWNCLEVPYYGEESKSMERVEAFFKIRQPQSDAVKQKALEFARFEKERRDLGIEPRLNLDMTRSDLLKKLEEMQEKRNVEEEKNEKCIGINGRGEFRTQGELEVDPRKSH